MTKKKRQSHPTEPQSPSAPNNAVAEPSGEELAKMVQARISSLEDTKKKSDALKFCEKGFIRSRIDGFTKGINQISEALVGDEPLRKKLLEVHTTTIDFFTKLETLFLSEVSSHKKESDELTQTKANLATFQKLCRSLQTEKNAMKKKFAELEEAEKKWRSDLEKQFEDSIKDIRSQISNHENTNKSILEDNEKLRMKMIKLMEQDQIYLKENELLKQTMEKKDERALAEKHRHELIIKNVASERDNLTTHLKTSLEMNKEFNSKLEEYRGKYLSLQDAMTQSGEYNNQLKVMNDKLQKGIKTLHKSNDEFLRKAKGFQNQVGKLETEKEKVEKQNSTLSSLSRKLRGDLRELRAENELLKEQLAKQQKSAKKETGSKSVTE